MLYMFLMDDVARKQLKKPDTQKEEVELVESPTGELAQKEKMNILRTRSAKHPQRKLLPHALPLGRKRRDSLHDDSLPSSPQLPAFAATKTTKDEVRRGENRLTM
jgi:hypothetical protein